MKNFDNSKNIQVSFLISILVHICLFISLYSPLTQIKKESTPISVDFMSLPESVEKSSKTTPSLKMGRKEEIQSKVSPSKSLHVPAPPVKTSPAPKPQEITKAPEATAPNTPEITREKSDSRAIEVPKTPSYPGTKELIPSLDELAKIGKGGGEVKGEGGSDEETVFLDSTDEKFTSYLHGVKFKIEGVWRYPEAARRSAIVGRGYVSFTIERDGSLSELKLLSSSGYPVLDEEILRAIKAASPFNKMLDNMKTKKLTIVATFEYNLSVQRIWGR